MKTHTVPSGLRVPWNMRGDTCQAALPVGR